jgi:N-dimethylarginine dimethylaminohydrolase
LLDAWGVTPPVFLVSSPTCALPCPERGAAHRDGACSFRVAWCINPHMKLAAVEPAAAVRQHGGFVRRLSELGADVLRLPFVHGAYDSVFVKDTGVLIRRAERTFALLANPRHSVRRAEQAARARVLEAFGVEVLPSPAQAFEGGDVVMQPSTGGAFLGHGFRSSPTSASSVERLIGAPVVPVELRDAHLFHLDMALAVLRDGTHLVCEDAMTADSVRSLRRAANGRDVVRVPLEEARRFALNFVELEGAVVTAGRSPTVHAALKQRGLAVHQVPLAQFHRAGGSAACLVSRIHVDDRAGAAQRSTAA